MEGEWHEDDAEKIKMYGRKGDRQEKKNSNNQRSNVGEANSQWRWKQTIPESFTDQHPRKKGAKQENEMQLPDFQSGSSLAYKQATDN